MMENSTLYIPVGLALIGLAIMVVGAVTYFKGGKAAKWPTVPGKVLVSQVNRSSGSKIRYAAYIVYQYSIAGSEYTAQTVTPAALMGIEDTGKNEAESRVSRYPLGSAVTVYYDPDNPRRAVLEKGGDSTLFILGGIFLVFGAAAYFIK